MSKSVWIENLILRMDTSHLIILDGNVEDSYYVQINQNLISFRLPELLAYHLQEKGWKTLLLEPNSWAGEGSDDFENITRNSNPVACSDSARMVTRLTSFIKNAETPYGIILNADKIFSSNIEENENVALDFLQAVFKIKEAKARHLVFLITDNQYKLPNPIQRFFPMRYSSTIPKPDFMMRKDYLERALITRYSSSYMPDKLKKITLQAAQICEGMYLQDIISIFDTNTDPTKLVNSINLLRNGVKQDPWEMIDKSAIENLEKNLGSTIFGQQKAIQRISDKISRAASILSTAAFHAGENMPRLKIMLAGPSGVGKTEAAKQIAKFIYGDEKMMIRFDMTEYANDGDIYRLIGPPPGYIGHEKSGTLTSAAIENPARVFLFDEFSHAPAKFLELLYQMLSDGRLTDSHGNTVSFALSTLIFTTNLGAVEALNCGAKDLTKQEQDKIYYSAIRNFFINVNMIPIYERFSESNIIVFDYLNEETRKKILYYHLERDLRGIYEYSGIQIFYGPKIKAFLENELKKVDTGHAIKNLIDTKFKEPLSKALFSTDCNKIMIQDVEDNNGQIVFKIEKAVK